MTERPILFSTPMVQGIISLMKGMTRRTRGLEKINVDPSEWYLQTLFLHATGRFTFAPRNPIHAITDSDIIEVKCPYGKAGDLLWVRETNFDARNFNDAPLFINGPAFYYKADGSFIGDHKWKPSIHMPKAAARIWLQVEKISVERLQDISEEDAIAEGIMPANNSKSLFVSYDEYSMKVLGGGEMRTEVRNGESVRIGASLTGVLSSFKSLWIHINGPQSWDSNPWVWVVKFKILSTTGKPDNL